MSRTVVSVVRHGRTAVTGVRESTRRSLRWIIMHICGGQEDRMRLIRIRVARPAGRGAGLSSGQQFAGQGVGHGGGAAGHVEFGEDVLDMVLGGAPADVQGLADVGGGGAVGEQSQDLEFA